MQNSISKIMPMQSRRPTSATRRHVLIVDDDASTREALASFVAEEGYEVRTASGGSLALGMAKSWVPDVVITDLAMPHMGGIELCVRLHELDPDLPVIVLTAMEHAEAGLACLQAGAEDYLSKPVHVPAVAWSIQRALERRESQREREQLRARSDELCRQMREINEHLVVCGIREHERVVAEEQRQAELNALLQRLSEGIIVVDVSGHVRMINDAARAILGVEPGLSEAAALRALVLHDLNGQRLRAVDGPVDRALRGEDFSGYDVCYAMPDGQTRCLETTGTSVQNALGEVTLAIVVFHDVTKLRSLERRREEYTALISHDLRTPLSVVLMSTQLLRESLTGQHPTNELECINRIERNSQRMTAMLDELTEATRLEHRISEHTECDLNALVFDVVAQLDDVRARRIAVEGWGPEPCRVMADSTQLSRCILNLLTNALKYSSANAPVQVRVLRTERHVQLAVIDHGIGIAPQDIEHIFDRYQRTAPGRAHAEGLGLGLYITRLIAEAHGGRVDAHSEVGTGSTFTLTLPLIAQAP